MDLEVEEASPALAAWVRRGQRRRLGGFDVFTLDVGPHGPEAHEPLLVIHGFPTASYDFHHVVDELAASRRVLLLDLLGFGLSAKPDLRYTMGLQADLVAAFVADVGVERLALLTHDMGDTVGGELLARQLEGAWPVEVTRRVLLNGSIYIELAHLSVGQQLLLSLPDEVLSAGAGAGPGDLARALRDTMSPGALVDPAELADLVALVAADEGARLLPRLIRYIEERRANQGRFTGAIERHPSPLVVVWGEDDPIAVPAMVDRLAGARPDAAVTRLQGVGHFPMVEAPGRLLEAMAPGLA